MTVIRGSLKLIVKLINTIPDRKSNTPDKNNCITNIVSKYDEKKNAEAHTRITRKTILLVNDSSTITDNETYNVVINS